MDETLNYFEAWETISFVGIFRGMILPGLLRWCRISSTHSIFSFFVFFFLRGAKTRMDRLTLDRTTPGNTFDGIGGLSGGGATSAARRGGKTAHRSRES